MSGSTPVPRLDDRYELADRTGHSMGGMPLATLQSMIRQGRLFRTDRVSKNGAELQPLGDLQEFVDIFDEVLPKEFTVEGSSLRPAPEISGEVDTLALAGVFARLYRKRSTGRLFITDSDTKAEKVVIFQQGISVNAMSNIEEEWLGEVLINHGIIDKEAFDEAVATKAEHSSRIGSALVHLEKLSPRELHRALSVQAMERLMNLFRMKHGTFRFVPDETASEEEMLLLASPRDIIETGLATAITPQVATKTLASYGDPVLSVEIPDELESELSPTDKAVIAVLEKGLPLSQCLAEAAGVARLTTSEARVRILAMMCYGVVHAGDAAIGALETTLRRLQGMHYFAMLDVRRGASADDVATGFKKALVEHGADPADGDSAATAQLRQKVRNLLEDARRTLASDRSRPVYERALQLGLDYHQPEVRKRIEHEHLVAEGRSLLTQQHYDEARAAFVAASEQMPDDPGIYVQIGWAQFLGSEQNQLAAEKAVREVQRGLKLSNDLAEAYLTIGKIYRLAENEQDAESNLRKAIELDPHNQVAQSELRLLFSRELGKKGGGPSLDIQLGSDLAKIVLTALVASGLLFVGANVLGGGAQMWPDISVQRAMKADGVGHEWKQENAKRQHLRHKFTEDQLIAAAVDLTTLTEEKIRTEARRRQSRNKDEFSEITAKHVALEKLLPFPYDKIQKAMSASRKIPAAQQVMGNVEYYYLTSDSWWWARRVILLLVGIIGIVAINRRKFGELPYGAAKPSWALAAIPYGAAVGFLSGMESTTGLGGLLGMAAFHVLAEQVFFIWFVGYGLLKAMEGQEVGAVALTTGLYAAYQLTFFSILNSPGQLMMLDVARIGAFIGGASMLFMWRSGGFLAAFLAQLAFAVTLAVKTGIGSI